MNIIVLLNKEMNKSLKEIGESTNKQWKGINKEYKN